MDPNLTAPTPPNPRFFRRLGPNPRGPLFPPSLRANLWRRKGIINSLPRQKKTVFTNQARQRRLFYSFQNCCIVSPLA